jgi:hypothetical protein
MKVFAIGVVALFSAFSSAQDNQIVGGKVICSQASPSVAGFELINVRNRNREYVGASQIGDLKISGTYYAPSNSFTLSVNTLDEDGIENGLVLSLETELRSGRVVHAKTKLGDGTFEIYCNFTPPI